MVKRSYTLVDVAEKLGKARTTVNEWSRQFREFLPTVGSGRTMRYTEESLELFALIAKMKASNEPYEYIKEQLHGVAQEIIVMEEDDTKPVLMQLSEDIEQIKRAIVELAKQQGDSNAALSSIIVDIEKRMEQAEKGVSDRLGVIEESLSRVETRQQQKKKPVWMIWIRE